MEINDYIKDGKLSIPENEIDNIYIWTQVSRTQEVLMSACNYFQLMQMSFEKDTDRVISVLKERMPAISRNSYTFSDFITFTANKSKIFNDKTCFAYSTSMELLNSLACYLAHTMNRYVPQEDSLSGLIINKIDEPDRFTKFMDAEFIILKLYGPLPEHKYRNIILDLLLSRRSKQGLSTLIYVVNPALLISPELISKERAQDKKLVDLSALISIFEQRRKSSYQSLMKLWFEMLDIDKQQLVYSKTRPIEQMRTINRQ